MLSYAQFIRELYKIPKVQKLNVAQRKQLFRELNKAVQQAAGVTTKVWRINHRPPELVRTALVYDVLKAFKVFYPKAGYSVSPHNGKKGPTVEAARICFDAAGLDAPGDFRDMFRTASKLR